MRNTNLFEAIGGIDNKKITDALAPVPIPVRKNYSWMKITSVAACLVVIVGVAAYGLLSKSKPDANISVSISDSGSISTPASSSEQSFSPNVKPYSAQSQHLNPNRMKLLDVQEEISAAKLDGELSFVESVELNEDSEKVRIVVTTKDMEKLKKLKSNTDWSDYIEIKYSEKLKGDKEQ